MSMVSVQLSRIVIDEKRQDQVIVLKETDGTRKFPIMIGPVEASSIKLKLAEVKPPRPLTHDLLVSTIEGLGARLEAVEIDALRNGTFFAKLVLNHSDGKTVRVDARPSDTIALAVRTQTPIFVADEVLDQAAISEVE
ncbi:MAG: bifunctional nuclease family protein [Candidatus Omnitrophota bacterium]